MWCELMDRPEKITPRVLKEYKVKGRHFACLTAYDTPSARLSDEAGIELILVGDSLGMAVLGLDSTRPVTFEQMLYHTQAARRGVKTALFAVDMPYETMTLPGDKIIKYAKRFVEEGGADAVKIEGPVFELISQLTASKIPVIAHLGLTPQSVSDEKGYKVQAKTQEEAEILLENAKKAEAAGAFALVLECIPLQTAKKVTENIKIPTIGIGAGPFCDAQILVWHDLLGWDTAKKFKFVRRYLSFGEEAVKAIRHFKQDVSSGSFPNEDESFGTKELL